ncbi:MAG: electron transport complex subunit RsxA [Spirochaetia bacterium]|nr:electron transport complex subunit RsxA [Spirochaetia bacterium]MBR4436417.1 electron transport complex subunit RsxA [Spirochaetales bacterium]MBR4796073.1 electron transport complex subunit RsxA [Spirochaetia bacterium]MBR5016180.1 electron transport complex subunit RsxA [Spirochaetia bacterium]MBR5916393.1 electron transport complex subunit RsxA [Spirochaetia bacterium]
MSLIAIIITYVFINNFILNQFMGMCPFIGVSKDYESAIGMGFAVTFVTSVASLTTWCIQHFLLVPFGLTYLQTITFILVIAALVQFVEMVVRKVSPSLYKSLGIFLPLITTNCAVLGIAIIAVGKNYNAIESFVAGMAAGLGFLLAIVLMSCIREKLADTDIPKPFKGVPIAFITASLMALAFMAFDAALLNNLIG